MIVCPALKKEAMLLKTRIQRYFELTLEERDIVMKLAVETRQPLYKVFEELYPEETCPSNNA